MITIIEFYGIKFTSSNFQIEVELRQSLVVSPDEFLGNCFINKPIVQPVQPPLYLPREPDEPPQLLSNDTTTNEILTTLTKEAIKEKGLNPQIEIYVEPIMNEVAEIKEINHNSDIITTIEDPFPTNDLELSEFEFDAERLEESAPLHLKRPIDQYYKEYNDLIEQANKLKKSLSRIYSAAKNLKETYSLNVDNIEQYIYSDIDISDNENDDDDSDV